MTKAVEPRAGRRAVSLGIHTGPARTEAPRPLTSGLHRIPWLHGGQTEAQVILQDSALLRAPSLALGPRGTTGAPQQSLWL